MTVHSSIGWDFSQCSTKDCVDVPRCPNVYRAQFGWRRELPDAPSPEKRFQLQTATNPISQIARFTRLSILIYDEHAIELYQSICAPYLMGVKVQNKGKRTAI